MRRRTLVGGSLAAGLLIALLSGGAPAGGADSAFRVDKLILTTFDGEQEPFLRHQRWDRTFPAAGGEFAPILCRTAGSDGFWVGADWADKADHILRERITAVDPSYRGYRCSSEFEDPAIAGALKRLGLLDRLLVVRTASDFEDQRPGTSPRALYDLLHSPAGFAGYNISRENVYRVAWQLAHTL